MLVSDAMTTEVVSIPADRSLQDVVEQMVANSVGSVVVERGGDPTGIVTKTDVLVAASRSGQPLAEISVGTAMSHPLVRVRPEASVRTAVERMRREEIKRLAVVDGIDLVGIVTQSDIVWNHSQLIREAISHEERRQREEREDD